MKFQIHASAAKAAIDSMTRSLGLEWGEYKIRVVGVAPGPIADTAGMTKLAPGDAESRGVIEKLISERIPAGRMGTKQDIALTSLFLCTSAADYITGETIVVDGGAWLWSQPPLPRESVAQMARAVEGQSRAVGGATSKL